MITSDERCCGCSACYSICPVKCISMEPDELGFLYPVINKEKCIQCGKCREVCPALGEKQEEKTTVYTFGGYATDEKIRKNSSSGGAFYLIARAVLEMGGKIAGAAFSEDFRSVHHVLVDSVQDLERLRGSKYVQSDLQDVFRQINEELQSGRMIVFSGTPCQIEGLRNYLGAPYENLLLIEVICHGVAAPKLFEKYIEEMTNEYDSEIETMAFREEENVRIKFKNGKDYRENKEKDDYFRMFISDTCLRESCYRCPSRGLKKRADITLSDFWGAENVAPDLVDGGGISLISVHTEKGLKFFERIENQLRGHQVSFEQAIGGNHAFYESFKRPERRNGIVVDIKRYNMKKLSYIYTFTPKEKVISFLQKIHLYEKLRTIKDRVRCKRNG